MSEQDHDGWTEHRLLVLAMLERHDDALIGFEKRYYQLKDECRSMISKAKEEVLAELKPSTEIEVAKVTSTWEFRATLLASITSIIVAMIALLS